MALLNSHQSKTVFSFVALVTALLVLPAAAAKVPSQTPDPDGKPAELRSPWSWGGHAIY